MKWCTVVMGCSFPGVHRYYSRRGGDAADPRKVSCSSQELNFGDATTAQAVITNDPDKNRFVLKLKDLLAERMFRKEQHPY